MPHIHRYPQALEKATRFPSPPTIPKYMFSFQAGQGGADFFFFLSFISPSSFFSKALEDNTCLQRRVEVAGWSSWAQHTSDTPPLLMWELGTLNFLSSCS